MASAAIPYTHLGEALATDYLFVREQFSDAEWDHVIATRPDRPAVGPAHLCRDRPR